MQFRTFLLVSGAVISSCAGAFAAEIHINEYNCVGSNKWIGNPGDSSCDGPSGETCSTEEDVHFGRVLGNGGNWIELIVTTDHLDARGWQIRWAETGASSTNGTNIWFGSTTVEQGIITFSGHAVWSDLRAGTIITIIERNTANGGLNTDISFNPCAGDWWMNFYSFDTTYISTVTNVAGDGPGNFTVGNDNWQGRIVNASTMLISGPVGEAAAGWTASGVNSREVVRLENQPAVGVTNANYSGGDSSTFGHPNRWQQFNTQTGNDCPNFQDFTAPRSWVDCGCKHVILNEFNAVGEKKWLNDGDEFIDGDGNIDGGDPPAAFDTYFGRIVENGGNWIELLVIDDNVDMRGWTIEWTELGDEVAPGVAEVGVITLSNDSFWSDVDGETIITFIDKNTAQGGLNTNLNAGPNWANINTFSTPYVASTASNRPGHVSGEISTGSDRWFCTIKNALGNIVFGPVGEGAAGYGGRGLSSYDVFSLQENPSGQTQLWSKFSDTVHSTFGSANRWVSCFGPNEIIQIQSFVGVVPCPVLCPADFTNSNGTGLDGQVNVFDLFVLLSNWNTSGAGAALASPTNNVDVFDLFILLSAWGNCN